MVSRWVFNVDNCDKETIVEKRTFVHYNAISIVNLLAKIVAKISSKTVHTQTNLELITVRSAYVSKLHQFEKIWALLYIVSQCENEPLR